MKKKVKYKKYYCSLLISILLFFIGMYFVLEEKNIDINTINQTIQANVNLSEKSEDDGVKLRKLYNINKYEISNFVYYPPKTNMDASEILIIKVNDKKDFKNIEQKINDRIKKQTDSFMDYDIGQYEILSKYVLEEKGDYIILIIDKESKDIKDKINSLF